MILGGGDVLMVSKQLFYFVGALCAFTVILHRVRMILALGNWVLGNICIYWVVLLLGDIFFIETPNTMPIRQQSAPST